MRVKTQNNFNRILLGSAIALSFSAFSAMADIRFWTTEEQPARLAKQEAMAAEFKTKTGISVEVIPVTEKDLGTRATAACLPVACTAESLRLMCHSSFRCGSDNLWESSKSCTKRPNSASSDASTLQRSRTGTKCVKCSLIIFDLFRAIAVALVSQFRRLCNSNVTPLPSPRRQRERNDALAGIHCT